MSELFGNVIEGATAGGLIGAALDGLFIAGATLVAGPVGFAAATTAAVSKTAAGTLIGGAAGVAKTISDESKKSDEEFYAEITRARAEGMGRGSGDSPDDLTEKDAKDG